MSRLTSCFLLVVAIGAVSPALTTAQTNHSVWSDKPLIIKDDEKKIEYNTFMTGDAIFAWTQSTIRAFARAHGKVSATLEYDFRLNKTTGSDVDSISGLFDVRRNGILVCHNCVGKAYWLSPGVGPGNYFKIYGGTPAGYAEKWLYSGERNKRFDF